MRYLIISIIVTGFLTGCSLHPKFEEERRQAESQENQNQSDRIGSSEQYDGSLTDSLLRLGRIIQSYLGRPYGNWGSGLDCSQFTSQVFKEFDGTNLPRTAKEQTKIGKKIKGGRLQYGDLVFFRTEGNSVSHVGIFVGFGEFAHSSSSSGVIISSLSDKYWKKRYAGSRRIVR
jgi:cell wall-associated NlpC family hydrolase